MAGKVPFIDPKKFKYHSSDKNSTTLEHKDGHTLKLAHNGLSNDHREQLKALSKVSKDSEMPTDKDEMKQDKEMLAEGGKVAAFIAPNAAKGVENANNMRKHGKVPHGATIQIPTTQEQKESEGPGKVMGPNGEKPKVFAEGGDVDSAPDLKDVTTYDPSKPIPESTVPVDSELARKRELYNLISSQGDTSGNLMAGNDSGDPSTMFRPDQDPQGFDSANWQKAEQTYAKEKNDNVAGTAFAQDQAIKTNAARVAAGLDPVPVPNVPDGPQIPGSMANPQPPKPDQIPGSQPQQNPMGAAMAQQGDMLGQGYQNEMSGIQNEAKAQGALGQQQSDILNKQVQAQQQAQSAYKASYDALDKERQAHMQDVKDGYIDPNKYWTGDKDGNGSHSKIMSGIGMILAGFNPTNRPNAAIEFLNKQMDMNLDAQKTNLNQKNNLLQANLRQFGNLKDATDMTRLMQADIVHNQLLGAAATASSPLAQAAAQKAAGQLQMQYAPLQQQMAMRRAMMSMANSADPSNTSAQEQMIQYARMTNPEMAKEMESRLVPQVGMAKIPVPQEVRDQMVSRANFDRAASNYANWAKKNAGTLSPAKRAEGATMAAELQGMYRQATHGGVFKEGEQDFIEKLVPSDPAQFLPDQRTLPKINALIHSNQNQLNGLKSGYGIPQTKMQDAPQVKTVNGVKYMRGPDGKAVPVKQLG